MRADERERLDERARDAAVEDVADDRDVQALERAERLAHREEVEQRLRRMLVLAVAGVHDRRVRVARDELRRADLRVPDDDRVRLVRASVSTVSFSDSPLSTDEPAAFSDIVSAESRFAASSKLDDVRVEDSKKRLSTSLPLQRRQLLVDALRARRPSRGSARRRRGSGRRSRAGAS